MTETLVDAMVQTFRHGGANPPGSINLSAGIGPSPDPCFGGTGALSSRANRATRPISAFVHVTSGGVDDVRWCR